MQADQFPARFGKYILLDRLNAGGMAEVFRAKMTGAEDFERIIAIKCMLPQLLEDEQFSAMFVDEAKLAAQLNHGNIVQIYELGRLGEQLYIAMELVHGRDLRDVLRTAKARDKEIPIGFTAYILSKAAEGLDFAHKKVGVNGKPLQLVHRDVSPQNIIISYNGDVKVADFGIAKAEVRATETRAGVLKGKFAYMAPEQVVGHPMDHRADVFALGAVLFEMLAMRKMFIGDNDFALLEKVRHVDAPKLTDVVPDASVELEAIIAKAISKDPEERFESAAAFAEQLAPLRIVERTIFEAKDAAIFMHDLYAEEIAADAQRFREFATVTESDCRVPSQVKKLPRDSEVFESNLEETVSGPGHSRTHPESMEHERSGWTAVEETQGFGEEYSEATQLSPLEPISSKAVTKAGGETQPSHWGKDQESMQLLPDTQQREMASLESVSETPMQSQSGGRRAMSALLGLVILLSGAIAAILVTRSFKEPWVSTPPQKPPAIARPQPKPLEVPVPPDANAPDKQGPEVTAEDNKESQQTQEEPQQVAQKDPKNKNDKRRPTRFGFLSVTHVGARAARIYIDGKDVGYSPKVYQRVKTGKRRIRVVEEGGQGRSKRLEIIVNGSHTRKDPLKLKVTL